MAIPLRALVLNDHLYIFIEVVPENAPMPRVTLGQLIDILAVFHPGLRLDGRVTHRTALQLFNLLVLPYLRQMEDFEHETGVLFFWDVTL
ncbi:hypothetical protein DFH28DRAFT_889942 [Melampsora americana]|nr:hypothetical protein DFH28DRAFT_889942 [Melampsora americana]